MSQEKNGPEVIQAENSTPVKSKKGWTKILGNLILIALIALGIVAMFGIVQDIAPQSGAGFYQVFSNANALYMAVLALAIVGVMALDCSKFFIINKTVTGKIRPSVAIKTSFLGKYYDAVTPFSTGGQPMQIYYLNTKGISGGSSTAIVTIRYFSSVLCWIITGTALMVYGTVCGVLEGAKATNLLKVAGWVGIGVNAIIPLFIVFFLAFPKSMYKLTSAIVRLGNKLKIVKDTQRTTDKAVKCVDDFKLGFKVMATTPVNLIALILVSFAEVFLTFSIPFFVMKALSCSVEGMLISVASLNAFATFGVSFIPTPGNTGVVEGVGALAFSATAGSTLAWSVLIWRLGVYYVYVIIGLFISVIDIFCGWHKKLKLKKLKKQGDSADRITPIYEG